MTIKQGSGLPQVCPYLGTKFDRGTAHLFPALGNYCYHCKHPATPLEMHQREYCLSSTHPLCEVYLQDESAQFPHRLEIPEDKPFFTPLVKRILLGVAVIALLGGAAYVLLFRQPPSIERTPTRGYTPAPTETPTILFEFIPDTSGTQADVQNTLNVIEKETDAAVYFMQTSAALTTTNTFGKLPTDTKPAAASKTPLPTRTNTPLPEGAEDGTIAASKTPIHTPTPINTRTKTPTATATRTPKISATKAPSNTAAATAKAAATASSTATKTVAPTKASTPTATQKSSTITLTASFHALDQSYTVNGQEFLVHMVKSGENYEILANNFQTTTEILLAINHNAPSPLWVKSLIVVAPGLKADNPDIPALQAITIIDPQVDIETFATEHNLDLALTKLYNNCSDNCTLKNGDWVIIPYPRE